MARLRRRITNRARRYGSHIKRRFREDPFSTIVLYSVLLSLIFLVFAFRGLIFTLFVKPIGIVNPSEQETQIEETIPADEQGTDDAVIFKSSGTYIVTDGDTVSSIAGALGLDWKQLAELNNLQPPYSLTVGQELKLPQEN